MRQAVDAVRSLRLFHWAILAAVAVSIFTVMYYQVSSASCYPGTVLGRSCYRGYFSNIDDRGGDNVLPPISNNQALPSTSINSADALYNLLRSAYNSGSAQKHTGAAFIYNTMMAKNAPGTGRTVSNAEWEDLHQRLLSLDRAGKIEWGGNVSASVNSYWQGTAEGFSPDGKTNDDAYFENYKNEPGILIRDYNNNVIYKILRRCANPVGYPNPLPEARNYKLTPHVDSISPTTIEAGSKMSVQTSVDTTGDTRSGTTQWEITQINVNPGNKAPHEDQNGTVNGAAPCQSGGGSGSGNYFKNGVANCKNVAKGTGSFDLGSPSQNLKPSKGGIDVGDLPVGTRVCFALSVKPYSSSDNRWAHSKPICTVVGKKPKVQIWGSDIAVRGKIETSTSVKAVGGKTMTFGSWVEYGALSVGANSRFASGAGLNGQTNNNQDAWSNFTFANRSETGAPAYGNFTSLANFRPEPGVDAYFKALPDKQAVGTSSVNLADITFATGTPVKVRTAGNLTITGGDIPAGRSVVILATGTVTITGNINYTDATLNSVRDIPQVVIIAKNINIKDSVKRVDAWLVASGTINTCYNFSGNLTSKKCDDALAVNGPVITDKLILNRTAGSGTGAQSNDPAERFNLRPDAYLWAQLEASGNDTAQTVYSTELPPRF